MITATSELRALLRDCGLQAGFRDVSGRRRRASTDSQFALLRSLGIEIDGPREASDVLRHRRQERARRGLEPVLVAWNGRPGQANLTLPSDGSTGAVCYELDLGNDRIERRYRLDELSAANDGDQIASEFVGYRLPLPPRVPWGYHPLRVDYGGRRFESLIISAPRKAYRHDENGIERNSIRSNEQSNGHVSATTGLRREAPPRKRHEPRREWGSFLPLYALRTEDDWGIGDFGSLRRLVDWTSDCGGAAVGVLPLFSAFLDEPYEASPYRPASRFFWNELYIDVSAIPELQHNQKARALVASNEFRKHIESQRAADYVHYREVMKLKRQALALLARDFYVNRPPRFATFQRFVAENPAVEDYARFRAAVDQQRRAWTAWPRRMRDGDLEASDYESATVEYYCYAQWIAGEQLATLHQHASEKQCGLYLDLPVGVDPASYDVWRHQSLYLMDATTGSPPDPMYPRGQDWGLPPLHPERLREDGYRLLRRVLEANMKYARYLRIDHAMGLARLYCIPQGFPASDGAYLRYRAEEMFAVVVFESHRNQCAVMGENLGTVPRDLDRMMSRRGVGGMWIAPYELEPGRREALSSPQPGSVASLNTHDMPPFAAWRRAEEVADREALGLIDRDTAERERQQRHEQLVTLETWLRSSGDLPKRGPDDRLGENNQALLAMLLKCIAASPAALVLVNLEDLWFETRPQNVPGTTDERPNWTRKARLSLEELCSSPTVLELIEIVNSARHRKPKPR